MVGPTVELFSTSILSNIKVRTRHERYTSVLAIKKIPYVYHDLASDEDAKSRWRRKAKDPQLPGILVNNEWVGSYDDFEEAVEFGELELFLGASSQSAQVDPPAPHPAQSAVTSKDPSLYPTLPYAPEGAGRWKEPDADQFISSLNINEHEINDADVDALLADIGKLPSEPASTAAKKYVPSKEAAIKPLRLAKMGPSTSHQRMPSGSPSSSASAGSRASPIARYSATQRSTRALAAEAAALTSNRKTSGALLRDAVSQGKTLDEAMEESRMKHIVGQDNIDDLFASLGLSNVDIGDDEVDQFLEEGAIPQGLRLGGDRVHKPSSIADKARDEVVARDLALKAKERGHGSSRTSFASDNSKLTKVQPASQDGTSAEDGFADTLSKSGRTSALSTQASRATEVSSPDPELKERDAVSAELSKKVELEQDASPKSDDVLKEAPVAGTEARIPDDITTKPIGSASAGIGGDGLRAQDSTSTAATAEESDAAKPEVTGEEATLASLPPKASRDAVDAGAEVAIATQQVVDAEKQPETAETGPSAATEDASRTSKDVTSDGSRSSANVADTDADSTNGAIKGRSTSIPEVKDAKPSAIEEEPGTLANSATSTNAHNTELVSKVEQHCEHLSPSRSDQDKTPTKEALDDSIGSQGARLAGNPTEEKRDDLELELAQAAMIASRYENRNSGLLSLSKDSSSNHGGEAEPTSSATQPNGLGVTSPAKSTPAAAASPVDSPEREAVEKRALESSVRLGVGATGQTSSSRQVSSSSVSSSRRAIDVSRPIDPATLPPTLPKASSSDFSASPDTKKKRGIFGLGKEKEKEKEKEETTGSKTGQSRMAEFGGSAAVPSRHERTISQILREADAVLRLDDYASGSDNDDTEDSAMFGASSIDVAAQALSAERSPSRS